MNTLSAAITGVENAASAYSASTTTTANDQATADAVQAKLDAATSQVELDKQAQGAAASAFNDSLDALITAATAAKVK